VSLRGQVNSLRSLVQGSRDVGKWYAMIGNHCVFGCKVVPHTGLYIGLSGNVDNINPDKSSTPIRPEQYANIANVYGEVFLMPNVNVGTTTDESLLINSSNAVGTTKYAMVYAYMGYSGSTLGIAYGAPAASSPATPDIPQGSLALARITVAGGATSIGAGVIETSGDVTTVSGVKHTLRSFSGRLRGADGAQGTNAGVVLPLPRNPVAGDGVDNDCAINTVTGDFFQKVAGVWQLQGNIKGAKSAN